jgi:arylsulfatase A-like enzyme
MRRNIFGRVISIFLIGSFLVSCVGMRGVFSRKDAPNIVIILTDDMDMSLLPYMENVNHLIVEQGATLTNYFATASICCPSRATILRGQYPHNTDVMENFPGFRGFFKQGKEADTLAVWLNDAGYKTSLLGKYLNLYPIDAGRDHIPPGWTDWHSFLYEKGHLNFYYDYKMNNNGQYTEYGKATEEYSTDVIRQMSLDFIHASAKDDAPFFLFASVYAPHGPSTPARRHKEIFLDVEYPQKPSITEDTSDKPAIIQSLVGSASGDEFDAGDAQSLYIQRVQSLQAVDEMVKDIVDALEQTGQLENTYIIFTSDNGFHMGEHGLPSGKGMPYEEDIHVPFVVRGPGIAPKSEVTQLAANIDIALTVAEMAGVSASKIADGRSLLPLLTGGSVPKWRNALLIELGYIEVAKVPGVQNVSLKTSGDEAPMVEDPDIHEDPDNIFDDYLSKVEGGAFRGIRADDFVYVEYENGEREYYDLVNDPYQLDNLAANLDADTRARLESWLAELKPCAADSCRQAEEKNIK